MNPLDITISIILLIGAIRGFLKGFIFEIAVLGSLVVCYFLGFKFAITARLRSLTNHSEAIREGRARPDF